VIRGVTQRFLHLRHRGAVNLRLLDHRVLLGKAVSASRTASPSQLVRYDRFVRVAHLFLRERVLRAYLVGSAHHLRVSLSAQCGPDRMLTVNLALSVYILRARMKNVAGLTLTVTTHWNK
jgi:hypothetical protein